MNTEELELTKKAVELLNDRNLKDLKELLAEQNPADISNIFEEVPRTDVILLFRLLPKELAADTFAHLDSDEQELIIKGFSDYTKGFFNCLLWAEVDILSCHNTSGTILRIL